MDQAMRNLVEWSEATPGEALHMATAVPARLLGDDTRGRLVAGARADLALWDRHLNVTSTVIGGRMAIGVTTAGQAG
jgi:N-acetylglucosamine-6-phosphate deacetylase